MTTRYFVVREVDRRVFDALKSGEKKVETRAGTSRYKKIQAGDEAVFRCGNDEVKKKIIAVTHFSDVTSLLKKYKPSDIIPWMHTEQEVRELYDSFSGYREKIAEHGIIAMELQ